MNTHIIAKQKKCVILYNKNTVDINKHQNFGNIIDAVLFYKKCIALKEVASMRIVVRM